MAEADELRGVLEFGVDGLGDPTESNSTDIEVASQGETFEEARSNLVEALELLFEDDAGTEVAEPPTIVPLDVAV